MLYQHMTFSVLLVSVVCTVQAQDVLFTGSNGSASFRSDAPLELIHARSEDVSAVLNLNTNRVAFSVRINSFEGFNSALQREHFKENYLESTKHPVATFAGKIIEQINFTKPGQHDVRVKGMLSIHGVEAERILPGRLVVSSSGIHIHASFSVALNDHDIQVPKLLSQKIAENISVQIDIDLQKQD